MTTRRFVKNVPEEINVTRLRNDVEDLVEGNRGVSEIRVLLCEEEEAINGTP